MTQLSGTREMSLRGFTLVFASGFVANIGLLVHAHATVMLVAWGAVGLVGAALMGRIVGKIEATPTHLLSRIVTGIALTLTPLVIVLYLLSNSGVIPGAGERDELIVGGLNLLFSGENPFHFQVAARAPLSVFPSWLMLNIPFYTAAKISPAGALYAVQNIVAFYLTYWFWRRFLGVSIVAYALFLLAISLALPNLVRELVSGSDFLANALLVSCMGALTILASERMALSPWLLALAGAIFISRLHFALVLAPIAGYYLSRVGIKETARRIAWMVIPSSLLALLFWAWDPARFMPLHTSNYLGEFDGNSNFDASIRFNFSFIVGASVTCGTALLSGVLCYWRSSATAAMYSFAVVVAAPILAAFCINSIRQNEIFLGPYPSHALAIVLLLAAAIVLCAEAATNRR